MADIVFRNLDDTNLKDEFQTNVTDNTVRAYTFTGNIGSSMLIDVEHGISPVDFGEVTLTGASASTTYSAFKGSGSKLAVYKNPPF